MPDFTVTLTDAQVDSFRYLSASIGSEVAAYIQTLVEQAADNTSSSIEAKVALLGLVNPEKEARVRAILVEP